MALHTVSELVQYHKIQQITLDQSSPDSLQVFLLKAHRHNFGENLMWLKTSRCGLSFVGCVGGGNVVSICIIMTLLSSSHRTGVLQSWCLPDVWLQHVGVKIFYSCCEKFKHLLLTLVLLMLTFSILLLCNCEDDFHLEVDTKEEHDASNQQKHSLKFVVEKNFDHHSHGFSAHMLAVYQSPVLYAWTMLHDRLVDFSPIHACWCLHFSGLLAGILSSSKTLKPLQLFHHSMPAPSLLLHLSRSDCLPAIGAKVIDLLSSPLGSQSRSKWETLQSNNCCLNWCWACSSICNTTFSGILLCSSSSVLGSRYLDISPEGHNVPSQAGWPVRLFLYKWFILARSNNLYSLEPRHIQHSTCNTLHSLNTRLKKKKDTPHPHGMAPLHAEIPYSPGQIILEFLSLRSYLLGEVVWGRLKKRCFFETTIWFGFIVFTRSSGKKKSFSHPNKTTSCWAVVYTEQGTSKSTSLPIANRGPS